MGNSLDNSPAQWHLFTDYWKRKQIGFGESHAQQHAFHVTKQKLTSAGVLTHFDPQQKVILTCDASPYGVGAIIAHQTSEAEKPIALVSCFLSAAQKKYAHLDKGLAIIFGRNKFHD